MEGISNKISPVFGQANVKLQLQPQPAVTSNVLTEDQVSLQKKRKKRKNIIIGSSLTAIAAVATGVLYRHNIANFASDFVRKVYAKMAEFHSMQSVQLSLKYRIAVRFARFLDKTIMSSQIMVNFSAMKDSVLNVATHKTFLGRVGQKLTSTWESLAVKAVKSDYSKCEKSFLKTESEINKILAKLRSEGNLGKVVVIDGENYVVKDLIKLVEKNLREAKSAYNSQFSPSGFDMRNTILKERLRDVNEKFFDAYTSIDYYKELGFTRFTVEEWLAPVKNAYQGHILKQKMAISNNIDDKFLATQKLLKNVDKIIPPKDAKSRLVLNSIMKKLGEYKNLSGANEKEARQVLTMEIEKQLKVLLEQIKKSSIYKDENVKVVADLLDEAIVTLNMGQKGNLQEILTALKAMLPKEEYVKIRSQINKTSNKLNQVTNAEGDLYFDKLRDILLGSALSDVSFGMLSPLATMGVVLAMEDTEEERLSTMLRLGIPLIGGIGTSAAFLFMLASGGKAMVLSSIAGAVLNRAGTFIDKRITKKRQEDEWESNAKYDSIMNNMSTSSTLLTTGPVGIAVNKVANKSMDVITDAANTTANKITKLANQTSQETNRDTQ